MNGSDTTFDLVAAGELLVDMTPVSTPDGVCFQPNPGGAPCNFLAMAQKMGARTAFIGKVGADRFGQMLRKTITDIGIDASGLVMDSSLPTTLAFVHLDASGDRSFSFYRKGCADVGLEQGEVDMSILKRTGGFYFGSLAFTDEPLRSVATALIAEAKKQAVTVCYDPNYRPLLWPSQEAAVEAMRFGLQFADVLKVSEEEALLLTGKSSPEEAAKILSEHGIALVCVTLGEKGVLARFKGFDISIPGIKVKVVDTTGAGDAFFGTLMQQIACSPKKLETLEKGELTLMLRTANAAAALCVQARGAIPALPDRERVLKELARSE